MLVSVNRFRISLMTSPQDTLPTIELIGNPCENFYQLGVKDRQGYKLLHEHMEHVLKLPGDQIKQTLKKIGELATQTMLHVDLEFKSWVDAYAEGLNISSHEYLFSLLLPEFASNLGRWLPGLPSNIGCSSFFGLNKDNNPVHLRILDFSLAPTYANFERAIQYKFKGYPTIFSYSTAGMPFPALHAISQEGFSLALHQKFTPIFNFTGSPIFSIVTELLLNCHDEKSIIKFLKKQQSFTTWGINILIKDGTILEIDIAGDELHIKQGHVQENQWHYVNNRPLEHNPEMTFPLGIENYCDMRYAAATKTLKTLNKKPLSNIDIVKKISTVKSHKTKSAKNWNQPPLTMSTLSTILFSPTQEETLFNIGAPPKFFSGKLAHHSHIFQHIKQKIIYSKQQTSNLHRGLSRLMQSQKYFDFRDATRCYHEAQMSIELLRGLPEELIARFFFLTYQYLLDHKKFSRYYQRDQLLLLVKKLPPYLQDHCKILINKIERELSIEATYSYKDIKHPRLQKVLRFDNKLPFRLIHRLFTHSISPRVDILDVIYAYVKI